MISTYISSNISLEDASTIEKMLRIRSMSSETIGTSDGLFNVSVYVTGEFVLDLKIADIVFTRVKTQIVLSGKLVDADNIDDLEMLEYHIDSPNKNTTHTRILVKSYTTHNGRNVKYHKIEYVDEGDAVEVLYNMKHNFKASGLVPSGDTKQSVNFKGFDKMYKLDNVEF